jgi:hypothetical protein
MEIKRTKRTLMCDCAVPAATPVRSLPHNTALKLLPVAIRNQPTRQGTAAILIVFNRPTYSMAKPASRAPIGTTSTNTLAATIQQTKSELDNIGDIGLGSVEVLTAVTMTVLII